MTHAKARASTEDVELQAPAECEHGAADDNRRSAWPQDASRRRVLLVEDNDLLRVLFGVVLGDAGYEVLSFADSKSALAEMTGAVPPFDAVVTDIELGAAPDGWTIARTARSLWPGCRVLYLTSERDPRSLQGVSHGAFLSKPFDVARMADVLNALFAA